MSGPFRPLFVEVETDTARRTRLYEEWTNMDLSGRLADELALVMVKELVRLGCIPRLDRWCHYLELPLRPAHQHSARPMSGETPT